MAEVEQFSAFNISLHILVIEKNFVMFITW